MKWVESRKGELLPTDYHHVVFTIPEQLNDLVLRNKPLLYKILFAASAATLQTIAADPSPPWSANRFLFRIAQLGTKSVVPSPYSTAVVTGGGISLSQITKAGSLRNQASSCRSGCFCPTSAGSSSSKLSRERFPEKSPLFPWKIRHSRNPPLSSS